MAVDRPFAEAFDRRWTAAWNAHDADAVVALLAPDVEWVESGVRRVLRGHDDARRRIEADFRAVPDVHGETLQLFVDEQTASAAVHWRLSGTYEGRRPVAFEGVSLWRFHGDRLLRLQMLYDAGDAATQAGVAATPSTPARPVQKLVARAREARKR